MVEEFNQSDYTPEMFDKEYISDRAYAELAALRADLAEARADVARFEAALDAVNRELAQARKWSSAWKAAAKDRRDDGLDTLSCNHRLSVEGDRLRAELAQARADVATLARSYLKPYARALKQDPDDGGYSSTIIEFAGCYSEGETRESALANIEEAAAGWMLAALSMGQTIPEPMKYSRTIRALVVACRAMDCVGFVKMGQVRWYAAVRGEIKQAKQNGQQAGE